MSKQSDELDNLLKRVDQVRAESIEASQKFQDEIEKLLKQIQRLQEDRKPADNN